MQNAILVVGLHFSEHGIGIDSWRLLADWSLEDFDAMQDIYKKIKDELEHGKTLGG